MLASSDQSAPTPHPRLSLPDLVGLIRTRPTHVQAELASLLEEVYGTAAETVQGLTFQQFVRQAWPIVEPGGQYVHGWHIDAVIEHLMAVTHGEIRELLITMPPRHSKSLLVSVFWPAYVWTFKPETRWIFASYAQNLATRDSVKCRRLIEHPWYRRQWGHVFSLMADQNQKIRYETDRHGHRISTSVGGAATGEGGDILVCDDPHNVKHAPSDIMRNEVIQWWDTVMSTRGNDPATVARVVICQRVHERDLVGHLLENGHYEHLNLPAEYEPTTTVTAIGWKDPRTEVGELLWPERFTREEIDKLKEDLGTYAAAAQLQQRPVPAGGGLFPMHCWGFWYRGRQPRPIPVRLPSGEMGAHAMKPIPEHLTLVEQSWDMTFKDTTGADFVVGQVWGSVGTDAFLLDQRRARLDFPATLAAVQGVCDRWPDSSAKYVEDKANGPAILASLRSKITGLIAVTPKGSKEARAAACAAQVEAGNVWLPHPDGAPWVIDFLREVTSFPRGAHDDQVDAMTQYLERRIHKPPLIFV